MDGRRAVVRILLPALLAIVVVSVGATAAQAATIAAGDAHTCALEGDGTVTCWGADNEEQSSPPAGLTGVTEIAAGSYHTCALEGDGTVTCWGDDDHDGQSSPPAGLTGVTRTRRGRRSCVRARGRWHGHLLGQQLRRAEQPAGRADRRHPTRRRFGAHVRA